MKIITAMDSLLSGCNNITVGDHAKIAAMSLDSITFDDVRLIERLYKDLLTPKAREPVTKTTKFADR